MPAREELSGWQKANLVVAVTVGALGGAACSVYIYRQCQTFLWDLRSAAETKAVNCKLQQQATKSSHEPQPETQPQPQPQPRPIRLEEAELQTQSTYPPPRPGFAALAQPCTRFQQQECASAQTASTSPVPNRRSAEQKEQPAEADIRAEVFLATLFRHHPYLYHYGDQCPRPPPLLPILSAAQADPSLYSESPTHLPKQQLQRQLEAQAQPQVHEPCSTSSPPHTEQQFPQQPMLQQQQGPPQGTDTKMVHPDSSSSQPAITHQPPQQSHHEALPNPRSEGCLPQPHQPAIHQVQSQPSVRSPTGPVGGNGLPAQVDSRIYCCSPAQFSPYQHHPAQLQRGYSIIQVAHAQTATIAPVARVAIVNAAPAASAAVAASSAATAATIVAPLESREASLVKRQRGHSYAGGSCRQLPRGPRHRRRVTSVELSSQSDSETADSPHSVRLHHRLYHNQVHSPRQLLSMRRCKTAVAVHGSQRQLLQQAQQHLQANLQMQQLLLGREGSQDSLHHEYGCRRCSNVNLIRYPRDQELLDTDMDAMQPQQQPQQPSPQPQMSSYQQHQHVFRQGEEDHHCISFSPHQMHLLLQQPRQHSKRLTSEDLLDMHLPGALALHTNDLYGAPSNMELATEQVLEADGVEANLQSRLVPKARTYHSVMLPQRFRLRQGHHRLDQPSQQQPPTPSTHINDRNAVLRDRLMQPPGPNHEVVMLLGFDVRRGPALPQSLPPDLAYTAAAAFAVGAAATVTAAIAAATTAVMRNAGGASTAMAASAATATASIMMPPTIAGVSSSSPLHSPVLDAMAQQMSMTSPIDLPSPFVWGQVAAHDDAAARVFKQQATTASNNISSDGVMAPSLFPPVVTASQSLGLSHAANVFDSPLLMLPSPLAYEHLPPPELSWAAAAAAAMADDDPNALPSLPAHPSPAVMPSYTNTLDKASLSQTIASLQMAGFSVDREGFRLDTPPPSAREQHELLPLHNFTGLCGGVVASSTDTGGDGVPPDDHNDLTYALPIAATNGINVIDSRPGPDEAFRSKNEGGCSYDPVSPRWAARLGDAFSSTGSCSTRTESSATGGNPCKELHAAAVPAVTMMTDSASGPCTSAGVVAPDPHIECFAYNPDVSAAGEVTAVHEPSAAAQGKPAVGIKSPYTPARPLKASGSSSTPSSVGRTWIRPPRFPPAIISPLSSKHPADCAAATSMDCKPFQLSRAEAVIGTGSAVTGESLLNLRLPPDTPGCGVGDVRSAGSGARVFGVRAPAKQRSIRSAMMSSGAVSPLSCSPQIISPRSILLRSSAAAVQPQLPHRSSASAIVVAVAGAATRGIADVPNAAADKLEASARILPRNVSQHQSLRWMGSGNSPSIRKTLLVEALQRSSSQRGSSVMAVVGTVPELPLPVRGLHTLGSLHASPKCLMARPRSSHNTVSRAVGASNTFTSDSTTTDRCINKPAWRYPTSHSRSSQLAAVAAARTLPRSTPRSRMLAQFEAQGTTATRGSDGCSGSDTIRRAPHGSDGSKACSRSAGDCSVPRFMSPTAASRAKMRSPAVDHYDVRLRPDLMK